MNGIGKVAAAARIGLALWIAPALAQAEDVMKRPGPLGPGRCGERLVQNLQLSSAQQTALDALQEEMAEGMQPIVEQLHSLREQIEEAASAPSPDACAVGAMEIDAAGLHAKIDALRKAAEARFVDGLSTQQKATYDQQISIHPDCLAVGGGFFFKHVP